MEAKEKPVAIKNTVVLKKGELNKMVAEHLGEGYTESSVADVQKAIIEVAYKATADAAFEAKDPAMNYLVKTEAGAQGVRFMNPITDRMQPKTKKLYSVPARMGHVFIPSPKIKVLINAKMEYTPGKSKTVAAKTA